MILDIYQEYAKTCPLSTDSFLSKTWIFLASRQWPSRKLFTENNSCTLWLHLILGSAKPSKNCYSAKENSKAFKQQVRCNQKGLQRLREFVLSETKLRSAESLNLWSQIIPFSKNQKEVLQPTCYLNTLDSEMMFLFKKDIIQKSHSF